MQSIDPICGMGVNEENALHLEYNGKCYYFCSSHCLNAFSKKNQIAVPDAPLPFAWYKNKVILVSGVLLSLCVLAEVVPLLISFREALVMYIGKMWWAVLLGFLAGGMIEHFIPRQYFSHALSRSERKTIFYSVGLGFFASLCSCGILALSIQIHKKGASTPAVVAFLLASPWANFPLTLMLVGFFGIVKSLYIILSAIVIAITTGLIFQFLEKRNWIESNKNTVLVEENFSLKGDFKKRYQNYRFSPRQLVFDIKGVFRGAVSLADMVLWWILIGAGLASLLAAFVPSAIFHQYLGPTLLGLLTTLVFATVLEVCSEGTAPLAFEIYRQTGALGNSLTLLMAGVVTDYTEIGLLWHNVGKKTAIWLPLITVPQVIAFSLLANFLF